MNKEEQLQAYKQKAINTIQTNNKNLHVLEYTNLRVKAKIHCDKCGGDFDIVPDVLRRRQFRCPICEYNYSSRAIKTIEQERPDLIEWLVDEEDKKIGITSRKIIKIKCPVCGTTEDISALCFTKRIYNCHACNKDGISYPNKFLRAFLKQIKDQVDLLETEWNPNWALNYKYDGHIIKNSIDYIIEMHGIQHYKQTSVWDFKEQLRRDKEKESLSNENNVEQIIIECKKSNFEYIKKHIEESRLAEILDLTKVNWAVIAKEVVKDYTKPIADLYNQGMEITKIGQKFMIERHAVSKILKEAAKIGWCDYKGERCMEMSNLNIKITNIKTNEFKIIHNTTEACNFIEENFKQKISRRMIICYIKGYYRSYNSEGSIQKTSLKGKLYKDIYSFEYITDDLVTTLNDQTEDKEKT